MHFIEPLPAQCFIQNEVHAGYNNRLKKSICNEPIALCKQLASEQLFYVVVNSKCCIGTPFVGVHGVLIIVSDQSAYSYFMAMDATVHHSMNTY